MADPKERLAVGAEILGRKLYPLGFKFNFRIEGKSSGGPFTVASFEKDDRELRLWFRWELGGVFYRKGDVECTHAQYMQAIGREKTSSYPGFGRGDDLAGFRHLMEDFAHCDSFFSDDGAEFYRLMKGYKYSEPATGLAGLPRID